MGRGQTQSVKSGRAPTAAGENTPAMRRHAVGSTHLLDMRFRTLIGSQAWAELPDAVQRRFSKRLDPDEVALYRGHVIETRLTFLGRALAWLLSLVGSPLPKHNGARGSAIVIVRDNPALGGQVWTRIYAEDGRFPQTIHSTKCFSGATGLEEHIGFGIGMSLNVAVEDGALVFRSSRYFLAPTQNLRLTLPGWLSPGELEVVHREKTSGSFVFTLTLTHPRLGPLVSQSAHFVDVV